jgi:hypothetical protein
MRRGFAPASGLRGQRRDGECRSGDRRNTGSFCSCQTSRDRPSPTGRHALGGAATEPAKAPEGRGCQSRGARQRGSRNRRPGRPRGQPKPVPAAEASISTMRVETIKSLRSPLDAWLTTTSIGSAPESEGAGQPSRFDHFGAIATMHRHDTEWTATLQLGHGNPGCGSTAAPRGSTRVINREVYGWRMGGRTAPEGPCVRIGTLGAARISPRHCAAGRCRARSSGVPVRGARSAPRTPVRGIGVKAYDLE